MERIAPGIWRVRLGTPETATPVALRRTAIMADALAALAERAALPERAAPPFAAQDIRFRLTNRGCTIELPLDGKEDVYGFGLQLKSHRQTGKKKTIRVNSDPTVDTGDSHAPVPFYLSTNGYGVYVDTARYAAFYCGTHARPETSPLSASSDATDIQNVFREREGRGRPMEIDVPSARGVDIYLFAGPDMRTALQRYVLFSDGGCLPPLWGLGIWYRGHAKHTDDSVLAQAVSFREAGVPCDVYGLEPGWQTHSYPCSYAWDQARFRDPDAFIARMRELGCRINLWEHVFVHPASPIHEALAAYAADRCVWGGLIPDLTLEPARAVFAGYHEDALIGKGIAGFKLDECDNSDFIGQPWSFPEHTVFPSGIDGEQMHSLLGLLYQETIHGIYRRLNRRTYSAVRSSHALAAPYPFVLYSDLYGHRDFVRGVVNCGFGGLLWTPEVRDSRSVEELMRRLQAVVFSPQALVNAWYIKNPPWRQFDRDRNNADELMPGYQDVEARVRDLFRVRMSLIPYLYAAFARYRFEGVPPFRALVLDYPDDPMARDVDDEYLMGPSLLVAPIISDPRVPDGPARRSAYLPSGTWYCFWTHERYEGGRRYDLDVPADRIPVFVKGGSILPLAEPLDHVADDARFRITAHVFDSGDRPVEPFALFDDDGVTFDYERGKSARVELRATGGDGLDVIRVGDFAPSRYEIVGWKYVR